MKSTTVRIRLRTLAILLATAVILATTATAALAGDSEATPCENPHYHHHGPGTPCHSHLREDDPHRNQPEAPSREKVQAADNNDDENEQAADSNDDKTYSKREIRRIQKLRESKKLQKEIKKLRKQPPPPGPQSECEPGTPVYTAAYLYPDETGTWRIKYDWLPC